MLPIRRMPEADSLYSAYSYGREPSQLVTQILGGFIRKVEKRILQCLGQGKLPLERWTRIADELPAEIVRIGGVGFALGF